MKSWHQNVKRAPVAERTVDGLVFDSKSEARRWSELRLLERAGEISDLERQKQFRLAFNGRPVMIRSKGFPNGRPCTYTLDFQYMLAKTGEIVFEEHKGMDTPEARLRRAVVEALYNIEIIVTGPAAINTPRKAR